MKIVNSLFEDILPELTFSEKIYYGCLRKLREIKYFGESLYQRIRYGFPLYEAMDFRSWHSQESAKRLKLLRKNVSGHPHNCSSIEEWISILDEIIWVFENSDKVPPAVYSDDYDHRYEVTEIDGMKAYISMNKIGTIDLSDREAHNKRVQAGLDLFAKYYLSMWD